MLVSGIDRRAENRIHSYGREENWAASGEAKFKEEISTSSRRAGDVFNHRNHVFFYIHSTSVQRAQIAFPSSNHSQHWNGENFNSCFEISSQKITRGVALHGSINQREVKWK